MQNNVYRFIALRIVMTMRSILMKRGHLLLIISALFLSCTSRKDETSREPRESLAKAWVNHINIERDIGVPPFLKNCSMKIESDILSTNHFLEINEPFDESVRFWIWYWVEELRKKNLKPQSDSWVQHNGYSPFEELNIVEKKVRAKVCGVIQLSYQLKGVLVLVSGELDTFSVEDKKLLMVVIKEDRLRSIVEVSLSFCVVDLPITINTYRMPDESFVQINFSNSDECSDVYINDVNVARNVLPHFEKSTEYRGLWYSIFYFDKNGHVQFK